MPDWPTGLSCANITQNGRNQFQSLTSGQTLVVKPPAFHCHPNLWRMTCPGLSRTCPFFTAGAPQWATRSARYETTPADSMGAYFSSKGRKLCLSRRWEGGKAVKRDKKNIQGKIRVHTPAYTHIHTYIHTPAQKDIHAHTLTHIRSHCSMNLCQEVV